MTVSHIPPTGTTPHVNSFHPQPPKRPHAGGHGPATTVHLSEAALAHLKAEKPHTH